MSELVEQWRLSAVEWLEKKKAAEMLVETKNDFLAEIASGIEAKSEAEANRLARLAQEWKDYRQNMLDANHQERVTKIRLAHRQMLFDAWRSENANARVERHHSS